ncbi:MAG: solute carrier family 26 protein [Flavobacteriales bacterium]|nr:solute carrier family 26 protein [Flavobacteriales bacterium]
MHRFFPFLSWARSYDRSWLNGDIVAGLTVGMMLIPQGMAYAMLAGLPAIFGLYASIIPLLVYAVFGTSRQLAVGPVAMVSLLVASTIAGLGITEPAEYINAALVLALIIGAIQLALGLIRLGFLVNFLSHPVISGFTSAAALIIGLNQLKHLLGLSLPKTNYIHQIVLEAIRNFGNTNLYTALIGIASIALIIGIRKWNRSVPGALVAVVLSTLAVRFMHLDHSGVKIVGNIPEGLPSFGVPKLNIDIVRGLAPMAFTIALIAYMESIAVAKAIQKRHRNYRVEPDQELIGLGLANVIGSFFQAFPTTGGFSRTAVNDQAGAKTGLAAVISAVIIALSLLFLTPLFYYLPQAVLASIIMVAVFGLIDVKEVKHLWKTDRQDLLMLAVTFLATLTLGIEQGILTGVVLSLVLIIVRTTRPHYAVLGEIDNTGIYKNTRRFPEARTSDDILIIRFDARLYFANVQYFLDKMDEEMATKGESLKLVVLDCESINDIDSSGMHALEEFRQQLLNRGIAIYLVGVKGPVRDRMKRSDFMRHLGEAHFFLRVHEALRAFRQDSESRNPLRFNVATQSDE